VQVHTPLRFVTERPQTGHVLSVEIKFRGVLQAEDHRMLSHALSRLGVMRSHDLAPINVFIPQALSNDE
jgi:hypothetical protein